MVTYKKVYIKKEDGTLLNTILQKYEDYIFEIDEAPVVKQISSSIPVDNSNPDYKKYLTWKQNGGIEQEEIIIELNSV